MNKQENLPATDAEDDQLQRRLDSLAKEYAEHPLFDELSSKILIDRKRPFEKYPDRVDEQERPGDPSFPSIHTASAFSLATSLSIKYPKWYVIAPSALWACSVGFSRMNQGVHYPSDVLAGAVLGTGCAFANVYINKWLKKWLLPSVKKEITICY